jgi:integrase
VWVEKTSNGKAYRIRDEVGGEKVDLKSGYRTKKAADAAMTIMRAEQLQGTALVPRGGEQTLGQFCTEWWEDNEGVYTRVRSRETIKSRMDRYIVRMLGKLTLAELEESPRLVQRWVNDMLLGRTKPLRGSPRPLAPKTVRDAHGLMHQVLAAAVKEKLIRSNPCANTKLPEKVDTEMRFLTPAEADRLVAAHPEHFRPLILFLLATGCRWSEAIGLRLKNLDVLARKAYILVKTVMDDSGNWHDEPPKSRRGRRTASFPQRIAQVLIPLAMADDDRERRIFRGPRGGMIAVKDFYAIWRKACAAAGLTGLRIHDLRHTHVAWLIAAKVPLSAISRRIGHKSIAVTDDIYGHLLEEIEDQLTSSLEEVMKVIEMGGTWGELAPDLDRRDPVGTGQTPA